jgi:hypothetical protein
MGQKPICSTCKQPKTKVDEAMVSGFVGYIWSQRGVSSRSMTCANCESDTGERTEENIQYVESELKVVEQ